VEPLIDNQALDQLRAVFDRDHAQLLELLADVRFLCGKRSYLSAAKVFAEFRMRQERHLKNEEALLGDLQRRGRVPPALLQKCTGAHATLRDRIERTWSAVCRYDNEGFDREIAALSEALDRHERAEKNEVLPALVAAAAEPNQVANEVHHMLEN
jgi:hypothetical protein